MLQIITDRKHNKDNKIWVTDVEEMFNLKRNDIVKRYENNDLALKALRDIEGMTEHHGDMIISKFGAVALDNISTGGKTALLSCLYDNMVISTDEAGYNAINTMCDLSKHKDIFITSSCSYSWLPLDIEAYVNNSKCDNGDDVMMLLEVIYEE